MPSAYEERAIRGPGGTALFISARNKDAAIRITASGYAPLRITINKINATVHVICNKDTFVNAGLLAPTLVKHHRFASMSSSLASKVSYRINFFGHYIARSSL